MSSPDAETPVSQARSRLLDAVFRYGGNHRSATAVDRACDDVTAAIDALIVATVASQAHTLSTVEKELAALKAEYALAISWGWRPDVAQLAYRRLEAKLEAHPHPRSETKDEHHG